MEYQRAIAWLRERKRAYQLTFGNNKIVTSLRGAYRACFGNYAGERVMQDLVSFCRGVETCVIPNDRDKTLVLEGRREVLLRIYEHMNFRPEHLYILYDGKSLEQNSANDQDS